MQRRSEKGQCVKEGAANSAMIIWVRGSLLCTRITEGFEMVIWASECKSENGAVGAFQQKGREEEFVQYLPKLVFFFCQFFHSTRLTEHLKCACPFPQGALIQQEGYRSHDIYDICVYIYIYDICVYIYKHYIYKSFCVYIHIYTCIINLPSVYPSFHSSIHQSMIISFKLCEVPRKPRYTERRMGKGAGSALFTVSTLDICKQGLPRVNLQSTCRPSLSLTQQRKEASRVGIL